jgi:hypothetical protein
MACQHFQAQKVQERTRQELLARKKRGELQEEVKLYHGPNNYKDTKPQMSSLLVFTRVYRLEIQSVMLVFLTPLVN